MFALVDCNNFYASCERLFRPDLEGRPVVVLSNNDGCVIARSNEAKERGIPMGAAYVQVESELRRQGGIVFSSNYALYGDLSRRVMSVLSGFAPAIEVYSIDECFLDFSGLRRDFTAYGLEIARTVLRWVGIPVSVGIAPTKTLAKIANRKAKKGENPAGPVLDWARIASPQDALSALSVEDIWGISSRWGQRLRRRGLNDARALAEASPRMLRKEFGVVMERICRELRGVSCIPLETAPPPKRQLRVSRSFGENLYQLDDIQTAVTVFAAQAGRKLRAQGACAAAVTVFLQTRPFDAGPGYATLATVSLTPPSQDSGCLIQTATQALKTIFRAGYAYQKAGILLSDLSPKGIAQGLLFETDPADHPRRDRLMDCLDRIHHNHGRDALRYAGETFSPRWHMRQRMKSPAYTTRWSDLPSVTA